MSPRRSHRKFGSRRPAEVDPLAENPYKPPVLEVPTPPRPHRIESTLIWIGVSVLVSATAFRAGAADWLAAAPWPDQINWAAAGGQILGGLLCCLGAMLGVVRAIRERWSLR